MIYTRYRYAADVGNGKRVLEVGCGSGQGLAMIGSRAIKLVGGDLDPRLLQAARRQYGSRFPLVRLRAEQLPFADASFDVVLLFEASYYVPMVAAALDEFARVLVGGGTLMMVNANPQRPDFIPSPYSQYYHSADELRTLLEERGFSVSVESAFPLESQNVLTTVKRLARRTLFRLGLVPKTLNSRAFLKRLVYGPLQPLPASIPEGYAVRAARTPHPGGPLVGFKVFYVTARRTPIQMETVPDDPRPHYRATKSAPF